MAPHSSTLAWKIPWTEEPGRRQSMGSRRVRHDWATSLSLFTFMHWRRKWQPTPAFLPGESQDGGAWWAAVYGVAQSWTRLKWLSSSGSTLLLLMLLNTCFKHLPLVCWKMFRWYEMTKKSRKEIQWRNPGNGRIIRKFGKMFVIGYPYWWLRSYRYAGSQ